MRLKTFALMAAFLQLGLAIPVPVPPSGSGDESCATWPRPDSSDGHCKGGHYWYLLMGRKVEAGPKAGHH
ncbi:hypothetical protein BM221_009530 [Beauveria bassiana]|uniref:Uncharacterized protein n=1 Tax=Beauveria bassiana TaxID=176275 RepID=A0A2N6NBN8_BEABA|nr:hypothetical protein BM221_009530 [Beauveria bassiana]